MEGLRHLGVHAGGVFRPALSILSASPPKAAIEQYKGRPFGPIIAEGDSAGTAEAEMLAFAGLLVALRVGQGVTVTTGSCPSGISLSATQSLCFHDMLPSPMTEEFLCSAATEDFRCCWTSTQLSSAVSLCHSDLTEQNLGYQCGETRVDSGGGHTRWSVRCPSPAGQGQTSPAEPAGPKGSTKGQTSPEAIDGATVGTIVVASLIGVALVGGAVAVYLQV